MLGGGGQLPLVMVSFLVGFLKSVVLLNHWFPPGMRIQLREADKREEKSSKMVLEASIV